MKNILRKCKYTSKSFIFNVFLPIVFFLKTHPKTKKKYYLSICAIFKDEARYMREWIEYHRLLGIDHLYLYNNFSSDNYIEILKSYIEEGFITLTNWPYEMAQISAYQHCYDNFKNETYWLVFIDLDEFICPKYEVDIKKWIKPYDKYPSVIMYWLMFGTNGIIEYNPNKLVIEQYTCSWNDIRNVGKIALNTNYVPVKMYHHYIVCWLDFLGLKIKVPSINESYHFVFNYDTHKVPKRNTIQINHYWSKCISEYIKKIDKGDMFDKAHDEIRKKMDFFYWHENQNVKEEKTIFRFIAQLKMAINNIELKFK